MKIFSKWIIIRPYRKELIHLVQYAYRIRKKLEKAIPNPNPSFGSYWYSFEGKIGAYIHNYIQRYSIFETTLYTKAIEATGVFKYQGKDSISYNKILLDDPSEKMVIKRIKNGLYDYVFFQLNTD